ncbi:MAG: ribosome-associated translation inhibitor RaiA [Mucinivorans sp.]
MNLQIQSVRFDADQKLIDYVESKMNKLDRFEDGITSCSVIMKLDKDHDNGNKVVTVSLSVPGTELVAERRSHTFEQSADEAIDALRQQIAKRKKAN